MMDMVFMRKSLNASLKGSAFFTYSGATYGVKGDNSPTLNYQKSSPRFNTQYRDKYVDIRLLKLIHSKHIDIDIMDRRHFACEIDMNFRGEEVKCYGLLHLEFPKVHYSIVSPFWGRT